MAGLLHALSLFWMVVRIVYGIMDRGVQENMEGLDSSTTYHLQLAPNYPGYSVDPINNQFSAYLNFRFSPLHDTNFLQMTAFKLSIDEFKIVDQSGNLIAIRSITVTDNEWEVRLVDQIYSNRVYLFQISYTGIVVDKASVEDGGFIINRYVGRNKERRYLLTTNEDFSAVMPHFKFQLLASVNLSVNVPLGWTAIFNTIERGVSKDVSNPRIRNVLFETTPLIPFKNFLLVIGDLNRFERKSKSGVLVRSFIPRGFDNFLSETSTIPVNCLSSAESYLEQSIGVTKIDHVNVLGYWSRSVVGISVYPKDKFGIWSKGPQSDLLAQKLLVCKQTIASWLSRGMELEGSREVNEALSLFLSYRLIAEFEDSKYASVVDEALIKLSSVEDLQRQASVYSSTIIGSKEIAAILLMAEDTVGRDRDVFSRAMGIFVSNSQKQTNGSVFSTLIEAFQRATNYVPLCDTTMVRDFLDSWLATSGPARIDISLKNGSYLIQQTTRPERIVPLIIKEVGGKQLPVQWLMPSGLICSQTTGFRIDARIPYIFNSNGRSYTRVSYSTDIHRMFVLEGINKIEPGAQFAYIRDLDTEIGRGGPDDGQTRLLEFIGDSFANTKVESPLFVDVAFQLLEKYSNTSSDEVDDIRTRQAQNLQNLIHWNPPRTTLRNAILSEQVLLKSVINKVGGSRKIASNFYRIFLKSCAPNMECPFFPVEILSAVLCGSVLGGEDDASRQLLSQMITNLENKHDLVLYQSADRFLHQAWQCIYEIP